MRYVQLSRLVGIASLFAGWKHCSRSLGVMVLLSGVCSAYGIQQYSIQQIDRLTPFDINNQPQIVGAPQDTTAFAGLWQAGTVTQIAPPGLTSPLAISVNNAGEVIGAGVDNQGGSEGFIWKPSTGFANLSTAMGEVAGFTSINNLGEIAGCVAEDSGNGRRTACVWNSDGNPTFLPELTGSNDSVVNALNDLGQAVGDSGISGQNSWPGDTGAQYGAEHAVLWQYGNVIDLTPNNPRSSAIALNNSGQVIGWLADAQTYAICAFEWDTINGLIELPDGDRASALAINNAEQIAGYIVGPTGTSTIAVIWEGGQIYDLNDLIVDGSNWVLNEATGINDAGQIVGTGLYNGQNEGFLLTPTNPTSVPEPTSLLLTPELLILASFRRRRACRQISC